MKQENKDHLSRCAGLSGFHDTRFVYLVDREDDAKRADKMKKEEKIEVKERKRLDIYNEKLKMKTRAKVIMNNNEDKSGGDDIVYGGCGGCQ
ncbi:hypothetical protein ElyMa_004837900 [Elysia marginata]|uniref:IBB domain-containing protein n=1 Tax=Elysia marginata TaxID=1093978 RepID=A0AAV4IQD0_9GAST|nr:hypothetical protein ElyMa_004837900 [Elysia marginata]